MQKVGVSVAFLFATTAMACSFQIGTGSKPKAPAQTATQAPPSATTGVATTPAPVPTPAAPTTPAVIAKLGGLRLRKSAGSTPTAPATTNPSTTPTSAPTSTQPAPTTVPIMTAANAFGSGTAASEGFVGSLFALPAGTTKLPDLGALTPTGTLFTSTLNTAQTTLTGGFPGIDATRNENFAIRWEAALVVDNEADYTFRLSSDDGSIVKIDGMTIVDNDGNHALADKSGPVHLIKGTHLLTVDYFQTTGNVALQLFCKRGAEAEVICPTRL